MFVFLIKTAHSSSSFPLVHSIFALTAVVTFALLDLNELVCLHVILLDLLPLLQPVENSLRVRLLLTLLPHQNFVTLGYADLILLQRHTYAESILVVLQESTLGASVVVLVHEVTQCIFQLRHFNEILLVLRPISCQKRNN